MREIAIIGYGRLGKLAAGYLSKYAMVFVADKTPIHSHGKNIRAVPIKVAAAKKHVVLAVPINQIEKTLKAISPYLSPDAVVYDVCSVKEMPVKWMKAYLPKTVSVIGTHPLFGPDSAAKSLKGRTIVLCPVRASKLQLSKTKASLRKLKLTVALMKPAEHDRLMAETLFLTQFVCRGLNNYHLPVSAFTTQNYQSLKHIINATNNDSIELFWDMYRYNRFARSIPQKIIGDFKKLTRLLVHK